MTTYPPLQCPKCGSENCYRARTGIVCEACDIFTYLGMGNKALKLKPGDTLRLSRRTSQEGRKGKRGPGGYG